MILILPQSNAGNSHFKQFTTPGPLNNIDLNVKGAKFDNGKNMISLIHPIFLEELGKVLTYGANKYKAHNWQLFDPINGQPDEHGITEAERLKSAFLRHYAQAAKGEVFDADALKDKNVELMHWAQCAFYCMVMCVKQKESIAETKQA